jgi:hemerythrin-like metal-binding protein
MLLVWNDKLASGSIEIDDQHRELFIRVNDLLRACSAGTPDRKAVQKIIDYLTEYVVFHFGTEEKLMDTYRYSSTSAHKAQHSQFVKSFLKLKDHLLGETVTPELVEETRQLVVDWLLNHINYSDRALGMYLKLKR